MQDPVVEEVRAARRRISEACGNDPRRLVEFYRREQKKYAGRLWRPRQVSEQRPQDR